MNNRQDDTPFLKNRVWIVFVVCTVFCVPGDLAMASKNGLSPSEQVSRMISYFQGQELSLGDGEPDTGAISQFTGRYVAVDGMARRVCGRQWRNLSVAQQQQFTVSFEQLISHAIRVSFSLFNGAEYRSVGEKEAGNYARVHFEVKHQGTKSVLVLLQRNEAGWLLLDVNVDGVSLLKNLTVQLRRC